MKVLEATPSSSTEKGPVDEKVDSPAAAVDPSTGEPTIQEEVIEIETADEEEDEESEYSDLENAIKVCREYNLRDDINVDNDRYRMNLETSSIPRSLRRVHSRR